MGSRPGRGQLALGAMLGVALGAVPATAAGSDHARQCNEAAALALEACASGAAAELAAGLADCAGALGDEHRACMIAVRAARVEALAACHEQHAAVAQTCGGTSP